MAQQPTCWNGHWDLCWRFLVLSPSTVTCRTESGVSNKWPTCEETQPWENTIPVISPGMWGGAEESISAPFQEKETGLCVTQTHTWRNRTKSICCFPGKKQASALCKPSRATRWGWHPHHLRWETQSCVQSSPPSLWATVVNQSATGWVSQRALSGPALELPAGRRSPSSFWHQVPRQHTARRAASRPDGSSQRVPSGPAGRAGAPLRAGHPQGLRQLLPLWGARGLLAELLRARPLTGSSLRIPRASPPPPGAGHSPRGSPAAGRSAAPSVP